MASRGLQQELAGDIAHPSIKSRQARRTISTRPTVAALPGGREVGPTSVIERRSADIAIVGDSAVAYLTAYSLSRKGKKVSQVLGTCLQGPGSCVTSIVYIR